MSKKIRGHKNWLLPWKTSKTAHTNGDSSIQRESTTITTTALTTPTNRSSSSLPASTPEGSNPEHYAVLSRPTSQTEEGFNGTRSSNLSLENGADPQINTQSLWGQAYDALKEQDEELIDAYELLVKQELSGKKEEVTERQSCFEHMSTEALKHQETKGKIYIFGYAISIQQKLKTISTRISFARDWISDSVKASPEALVAWSVVLLALPLLTKPAEVDRAVTDGFTYVSLRMRYYIAMEDLLLSGACSKENSPARAFMNEQITSLYQKILEFQIKNIVRLHKNTLKMMIADTFGQCDWNSMLEGIKALDKQICQGSLQMAAEATQSHLAKLRLEAIEHQEECLQIFKDQLTVQQGMLRNIEQLNQRELSREEKDCLQSFCLEPHYELFKEQVEEHVEGTCKWFLKQEHYQNWLHRSEGHLLVTADPGCGKSVLAKCLIDRELREKCPGTKIAYFFFKDQQQNKLSVALSAILHQLLEGDLIKHALPRFDKYGQTLKNNGKILFDILCDVVNDPSAGPIILVFDGMDECDDEDSHYLFRLLKKTTRGNKLKVLLTSRPYENILTGFEEESESSSTWVRIPGDQESEAISEEIDLVIRHRLNKLANQKRSKLDPQTREVLETTLMKMEHRTYLWAFLVFDELEKDIKKGIKEMKAYLDYLPRKIEDAYEKILGKITDTYEKSQALKIIQIALGAARPLSSRELQIALVISLETRSHNQLELELEDDNEFEQKIRHWCGLLVQTYRNKVLFLHQTVREFFLSKETSTSAITGELPIKWCGSVDIQQAHEILARSSIAYLYLTEFQSGLKDQDSNDDESQERLSDSRIWYQYEPYSDAILHQFPFLTYSANEWDKHFGAGNCTEDESLVANAVGLCTYSNGVFQTTWRAHKLTTNRWWFYFPPDTPSKSTVATLLYCTAVVKVLLRIVQPGFDSILEALDTAWAVEYNGAVGNLLLDHAVAMDCNDPLYAELLAPAAHFGRLDLVMKLLEGGISSNLHNSIWAKALYEAARTGNVKITTILLEHGANPNLTTTRGMTALHNASSYDRAEMARVLLKHGADPNSVDDDGDTPLHIAAGQYTVEMATILLNNAADPNYSNCRGDTPLHIAAGKNAVEMVTILLDHKSNVNAQNEHGCTALLVAAGRGYETIVRLLLQHDANPMLEDKDYSTADDAATFKGCMSIAALLPKKIVKKRQSLSDLWPLKPFWRLAENSHKRAEITYNQIQRQPFPREPRRHSFSGYTDHE